MKRNLILSTFFLAFFCVISISQNVFAESAKKSPAKKKIQQLPSLEVSPPEVFDSQSLKGMRFEERFLNLGVNEKFTILERDLIKVQVKNFCWLVGGGIISPLMKQVIYFRYRY